MARSTPQRLCAPRGFADTPVAPSPRLVAISRHGAAAARSVTVALVAARPFWPGSMTAATASSPRGCEGVLGGEGAAKLAELFRAAVRGAGEGEEEGEEKDDAAPARPAEWATLPGAHVRPRIC